MDQSLARGVQVVHVLTCLHIHICVWQLNLVQRIELCSRVPTKLLLYLYKDHGAAMRDILTQRPKQQLSTVMLGLRSEKWSCAQWLLHCKNVPTGRLGGYFQSSFLVESRTWPPVVCAPQLFQVYHDLRTCFSPSATA